MNNPSFGKFVALSVVFVGRIFAYIFFYLYIVGVYAIKGNAVAWSVLRGERWEESDDILEDEIYELEQKVGAILHPRVITVEEILPRE